MEWSFEIPKGAVTVRQEGRCAICQAISRVEDRKLYKAWLIGKNGGRVLLGTLIPEGGALRLRRSLEISWLERQGVWPPFGAELLAAYPLNAQAPPRGWCVQAEPWRLLEEGELRRESGGVRSGFLKRDSEGFWLAFLWERGKEFPLPMLFCLAQVIKMEEKSFVVFRFTPQGKPMLATWGTRKPIDRNDDLY